MHYSYTLAQKASNYGIFCFYNNKVKKEWISQWGLFSAMIVGMIGGIIAG